MNRNQPDLDYKIWHRTGKKVIKQKRNISDPEVASLVSDLNSLDMSDTKAEQLFKSEKRLSSELDEFVALMKFEVCLISTILMSIG